MTNAVNRQFGKTRIFLNVILAAIVVLGLGIRLIDLDDPPLDFNSTRQLRSAIMARGIYYQNLPSADPEKRQLALNHMNSLERLEPPIFEYIVAWTYQMIGGENLWVARMYAALFWSIGALFLYDLGCRMTSPWAALVGVGIFMFLPFSIRASRSFQPDPGMVTLVILTAWALYRWSVQSIWKWALLAGFFGGLAVLVKIVALFFVGGIAMGTVVCVLGSGAYPADGEEPKLQFTNLQSGLRNPQIWIMLALMLAPALIYYVLGISDQTSGSFLQWTVMARWREVLTPSYYMRWMVRLDNIIGLALVFASLIGSLVTIVHNRALLWGFWLGYLTFGVFFSYHIATHDYYHLTLVVLVALSLMPLVDLVIRKTTRQSEFVQAVLAAVIVVWLGYHGWIGRSILVGQDFSHHPAYWQMVAEAIPAEAKAIGLSQDYGFRLMYYGWRKIALWPTSAEPENLPQIAEEASYFVVTAKNQMSAQLEAHLRANYPVYAQGQGYIIFDLANPLTPNP